MPKMTYNHWYIRLIFRHPPPRKGIARVSQVSNFLVQTVNKLLLPSICDTFATPNRHLFDTLGVGFFKHIVVTILPSLSQSCHISFCIKSMRSCRQSNNLLFPYLLLDISFQLFVLHIIWHLIFIKYPVAVTAILADTK